MPRLADLVKRYKKLFQPSNSAGAMSHMQRDECLGSIDKHTNFQPFYGLEVQSSSLFFLHNLQEQPRDAITNSLKLNIIAEPNLKLFFNF